MSSKVELSQLLIMNIGTIKLLESMLMRLQEIRYFPQLINMIPAPAGQASPSQFLKMRLLKKSIIPLEFPELKLNLKMLARIWGICLMMDQKKRAEKDIASTPRLLDLFQKMLCRKKVMGNI